jgi:hypothetical protein
MDCSLTPDGCRRFTPIEPNVDTVARGAIVGAAIRDASGLTRPVQDVYNASAIQLWQVAPHLGALFGRRFKRRSDLELSRGSSASHRDVLPDQLGVVPGSNSRRWTIAQLLKQGRKAAERAGRPLSQETCIQHGLHEAAKLNPVPPSELTKSKVRRMLRFGLFDLGPSPGVDKTTRRRVRDRFIAAVRHHGDDSNEEFQGWLTKNFYDDVVKQIAKKKKPDGPINRITVCQAIVEDSFESHFEVAECMDVGMKAFAASLAKPLNRDEKAIFAICYHSQPWLGGLTLLMLHAHFAFLRPAVIELLNNPRSNEARGTLIRLLLIYGEMASKRREADRHAAKHRRARNHAGRPAKLSSRGVDASEARPPRDLANELVTHLCETRAIICKCGVRARWFLCNADRFSADRRVKFQCERCEQTAVIKLTKADIQKLRREFRS